MLVDMKLTIAYKCASCGSFEFFSVYLFSLNKKSDCCFSCHCNDSAIIISEENSKIYKISIPCFACGDEHVYFASKKGILSRSLNIFYCPVTGIQQCFVGSDEEVRRKIDNMEKELDDIINMFGYDNYFKNTQVMFDSLNKIHDVAEQGNLYCECGNSDIELVLLSDKILLKCKKCSGNKIVYAGSNKDLKDILMNQNIILSRDIISVTTKENEDFKGESLVNKK